MNRLTPLIRSSQVALFRFDHPAEEIHKDPPEEVALQHSVSFVESGQFDLLIGRRQWRLFPGMVFITNPNLRYRCRHLEQVPNDVCLSISYMGSFARDVQRITDERARPVVPVIRSSNRLAYLRFVLTRLADNRGDILALETIAGELLAAAAGESGNEKKRYTDRQVSWYAERVEAVRALLATRFAEPHSLSSLGAAVGMSPFHFARVFRDLVGTPPHRYLLRVRLAEAAARLRQGASVTDTCFAVGFTNLSHFIRLFRRTFGVSPSCFHTLRYNRK